ncbi:signal peptidase I [Siminovitchia sp. FSL H7-0308]|uniref:signal peptidase I SipW n=1 Tax=Siminovitchia sp. FSL H7-0308 TaxID=2921432 RepID=UPI0030EB275E
MNWQTTKKAIGHTFSTLILLILAIVLLNVAISKASGKNPSIFGYEMKAVLSGSMEPGIKTGSIILMKQKSQGDQYKKGDVITFITKENLLITHRIEEVHAKGRYFTTKGDNNNGPDLDPVYIENIIAQYTGVAIPYAGYMFKWTDSSLGAALILFLPGILLIGYGFLTVWRTVRMAKSYQTIR